MSNENNNKIVVAEDDAFLIKIYKAKFATLGYDVTIAADGEEAISRIKSEKPSLVLLDLIMPKKNGFEVMTALQADEELKTIPVIVLSNLGQDCDEKKARDLGAVEYIIKSNVKLDEIIETAKKYLGS